MAARRTGSLRRTAAETIRPKLLRGAVSRPRRENGPPFEFSRDSGRDEVGGLQARLREQLFN